MRRSEERTGRASGKFCIRHQDSGIQTPIIVRDSIRNLFHLLGTTTTVHYIILPPLPPFPRQTPTPSPNTNSTAPPFNPTEYTAGSEPTCSLVALPVADPGTVTGTGTPHVFPLADDTVTRTMDRPSSERW